MKDIADVKDTCGKFGDNRLSSRGKYLPGGRQTVSRAVTTWPQSRAAKARLGLQTGVGFWGCGSSPPAGRVGSMILVLLCPSGAACPNTSLAVTAHNWRQDAQLHQSGNFPSYFATFLCMIPGPKDTIIRPEYKVTLPSGLMIRAGRITSCGAAGPPTNRRYRTASRNPLPLVAGLREKPHDV